MISNKIDDLKLMTGVPLIIEELGICIIQPTLKEIGFLGEENFYSALSYFLMTKEKLSLTEPITDFELFSLICNNDINIQKKIKDLFFLTIQDFEDVIFLNNLISLKIAGHELVIDQSNFFIIKETYIQIFCVETVAVASTYNPANDAARKIVEKLEKRKKKLGGETSKVAISIFANLISVLTIGSSGLSFSECLNLTVYQIYNLTKRFNLHEQYNMQIQASLQGAKDIKLIEWAKQI